MKKEGVGEEEKKPPSIYYFILFLNWINLFLTFFFLFFKRNYRKKNEHDSNKM